MGSSLTRALTGVRTPLLTGPLSRRSIIASLAASPLLAAPAAAQGAPPLFFGGHAYLTEFAAIGEAFPWLSRVLTETRQVEFDRALAARAEAVRSANLDIRVSELGRLSPGADALALVLAFDTETISVSIVRDTWKLLVDLSFQVLVYDVANQAVRASWPLAVQYIDAIERQPTEKDVLSAIERLLFGSQPTGLQATFWGAVQKLRIPASGARSLRVTQATLADLAKENLGNFRTADAEQTRVRIGHDFSKFLSSNPGVPVLPFRSSQATGGKIPARFSNGSAFSLTIPEADYEISIRLDGLKKVLTGTSPGVEVWIYGTFFTIRVFEPLSAKDFFNGQLKLGATRTIPTTLREVDDWPSFEEAIQKLFNEFTGALAASDEAWWRTHVTAATPGAPASLKTLKALVDSCK